MRTITDNLIKMSEDIQNLLNDLLIENVWGQVLKYNKSYIISAARPGHYGYNFQEQFITSFPKEILYKRSFLMLIKLGGDMKSDIARPGPQSFFKEI